MHAPGTAAAIQTAATALARSSIDHESRHLEMTVDLEPEDDAAAHASRAASALAGSAAAIAARAAAISAVPGVVLRP
eukprot:601717-Rhodomonas_salina.1